ncbi:HEAT repeat domain-containing protein [Olivibacter jilunii]|uniref:HEAT repeat domain-containing protein n=1 Tax=Olivibacter jilunii TaxID=985016 RepID=UPI003F16C84C
MEVNIQHLIYAIILLSSLVLISILIVLIYGYFRYKGILHKHLWGDIITRRIEEVIVMGDDNGLLDDRFTELLKKKSFRYLVLQYAVSSIQKFSGSAQENIKFFFKKYKLEHDAWEKLKNRRRPYMVGSGIRDLSAMHEEQAIPFIEKQLQHPSPDVYLEAQSALVSFKGFDGLQFFYGLKQPMSQWQQLRLLSAIEGISKDYAQHIPTWMQSPNESVIVFTLRLIRKFQLFEFYDRLLELFSHSSIPVRIETIKTLQILENNNTVDQLIQTFDTQPREVQIMILKALRNLRDHNSIGFLKKLLIENDVVSIRIFAAQALKKLNEFPWLRGLLQDDNASLALKQVLKHTLQEKV